MIVKVCDSCQKLLFDTTCSFVATRSKGIIAIKRGDSAQGKHVSHFCSVLCVGQYFARWSVEELPEPETEVGVDIIAANDTPNIVRADPQKVPPSPERIAEQNALLSGIIGRG